VTLRGKSLLAVAVTVVLCLALSGAWLWSNSERARGYRARAAYPHVVLVTFDTLNVWYTSLFSDDPEATPNLQALADSGVLFEQARTVVPLTLPSHTALLSGRMPWDTGVVVNGSHVPDALETLPEILSVHGYRTAAFLSLGVLNPSFNLDQGFDEYDPVPVDELGRWYRTADEVTAAAVSWMNRHEDEPFFVWLHLSDPHEPYVGKQEPPDTELLLDEERIGLYTLGLDERHRVTFQLPPGTHTLSWRALHHGMGAPEVVLEILGGFELGLRSSVDLPAGPFERPLRPRWSIDLTNPGSSPSPVTMSFGGHVQGASNRWSREKYRGEVANADHFFGAFRQWFIDHDLDRDTLWLIASDHGEGLGHGGSYGHAAWNREEQLRTLLLLRGPGIPSERRLGSPPVLLVDALPTVLDLLGLETPQGVEGRSLVECWRPGGCRPPRTEWLAYGVNRRGRLRSSSLYRWPLKALWTRHNRSGVFDLSKDPREEAPLARLPRTLEGLRSAAGSLPQNEGAMIDPLAHQIDALSALVASAASGEGLDASQKEMLRSLGYL